MTTIQTIIGVDCAVNPNRVGLALGTIEEGQLVAQEVRMGGKEMSVAEIIAMWISANQPVLLALDAPLGWPVDLGNLLVNHQAGQPLPLPAKQLFTRLTDRIIRQRVGKRPLEVGADLIARTAHASLGLLQAVRRLTSLPIPLAWRLERLHYTCAIEVYPAATLIGRGMTHQGYKKSTATKVRQVMLTQLAQHLQLATESDLPIHSADALDALVCLLAGYDFLQGNCISPSEGDLGIAQREGWIWVRERQ